MNRVYDALAAVPIDNGAKPTGVAAADDTKQLAQILETRRFDIANPPPRAEPRFRLVDATVTTPGNLMGVSSQAKQGKTAVCGAMIAATMNPTGDCLGFTADNSQRLAIVHFDTEQAPAAHHAGGIIILRRAGLEVPPPWFRSYRLADVSLLLRRKIIAFEMDRAAQDCGGLYGVFLDGLADFCVDPNDSAESFGFIDELHQLAIRYETTTICALHENPGSETGKTRGHLGSQLERKAETNLRLAKDAEGVTVVFADKARHAHIPKERGPRFVWDNDLMMHVSCATATEVRTTSKRDALVILGAEIFRNVPATVGLGWAEVHDRISDLEELKRTGARRRFDELIRHKVIGKRADRYRLNP